MTSKPEASRYTNQVLKFEFKEGRNAFYVPSFFLQDQSWLQELDTRTTMAWNFSEQVGHVFIHYLYTGDYQPLNIESGDSAQSKKREKLRTAVEVFLAIGYWHLPKLQEMVQSEIESLSSSIHIYDTFNIVDNKLYSSVFSHDEKREEWLINFLMTKLKEALENNRIDRGDQSLFNKLQHLKLIKSFATKFFEFYISQNLNTNEKLAQEQDIKSHDMDSVSAVILTPSTLPGNESDTKLQKWLRDDYEIEIEDGIIVSN